MDAHCSDSAQQEGEHEKKVRPAGSAARLWHDASAKGVEAMPSKRRDLGQQDWQHCCGCMLGPHGAVATTSKSVYVGRLAPSPTGLLHVGHAQTFLIAARRAAVRGPCALLLLRMEDIDRSRCREQFAKAALEDIKWAGVHWTHGPMALEAVQNKEASCDLGGNKATRDVVAGIDASAEAREPTPDVCRKSCTSFLPNDQYMQSQRRHWYLLALLRLWRQGWIYPCNRSRKDVKLALSAPHDDDPFGSVPGPLGSSPNGVLPAVPSPSERNANDSVSSIWSDIGGESRIFPAWLRPVHMQLAKPMPREMNSSPAKADATAAATASASVARQSPTDSAEMYVCERCHVRVKGAPASYAYRIGAAAEAAMGKACHASVAPQSVAGFPPQDQARLDSSSPSPASSAPSPTASLSAQHLENLINIHTNWRFRVPDGVTVSFRDGYFRYPGAANGPISVDKPSSACGQSCGEASNGGSGDVLSFVSGRDFGDFVVWRGTDGGGAAYELAVVVDDLLMRVTEVVRGQDLLLSTARQLLLALALRGQLGSGDLLGADTAAGANVCSCAKAQPCLCANPWLRPPPLPSIRANPGINSSTCTAASIDSPHSFCSATVSALPKYFHVPLLRDSNGQRLAKRTDAPSIASLREAGLTAQHMKQQLFQLDIEACAKLG